MTPRWTQLDYHPIQDKMWHSPARFKVVPAGRRSGKTEIEGKRKVILRALKGTKYDTPRFGVGAPTRDQAKRIYWDDLKRMIPKQYIIDTSESELIISLINTSIICVVGMDRPERVEGTPWDHFVLDEYANMKEDAWLKHIRPALSDRQGSCSFIGVPEGRNHYFDLYKTASKDTSGEWDVFKWISADILPPHEIESAKRDLDELTYKQEYEADFINFKGRAYYAYTEENNVVDSLKYFPYHPLILCFDFNVSPGICCICQEMLLPNGNYGTAVIDEVWIENNSNTELVCKEVIRKFYNHKSKIYCYGDATGGARGSAQLHGSDWEIIKYMLKPIFGSRVKFRVRKSNPREKDRLNSLNSRLKSYSGEVYLVIDKEKAPHLIKDFEGVSLIDAGTGEIDKKATPKLTHLCFGYDTLVETINGIEKIGEISKEGIIKTFDGTFVKYKDSVLRGRKECVKIIFNDNTSVVCTKDHLFLTKEGWKESVNLKREILISSKDFEKIDYSPFNLSKKVNPDLIRDGVSRFVKDLMEEFSLLKVEEIIEVGERDVYCPTVSTGCFCLANDLIVSNSDALGYYIYREFPVSRKAVVHAK